MTHPELKLPYHLARHILREKRHPQLRVWLALKAVHGSWCHNINKEQVADLCGFSCVQTVNYHLDKLLEWNWVGTDGKQYFFRSTDFLCRQYGHKNNRNGYHIDIKNELTALAEVLFMMSVKHIINFRNYVGRESGRLEQTGYIMQDYTVNTLSVRLLAKLIGITSNMVHRLKTACINIGYLDRKRNSRLVLPYEQSYLYDKFNGYLFTKDNAMYIRLTDSLNTFC